MFCTLFFASENKSSKLKICRASGDFFGIGSKIELGLVSQ